MIRTLPLVVLSLLTPLFAGCVAQPQQTDVISLPDGYIGWVRIEFGVKGARPLPHKNGGDVYVIPASGYLRTSSPAKTGVISEELQYVKGNLRTPLDETTMLWGDSTDDSASGVISRRTFFIGTAMQSDLADRVHASVGRIPLAALSAWANGRDLTYRYGARHNFQKAYLVGANFWSSSFKGSNFGKANLTYAAMGGDFTRANFRGANLSQADITQTLLKNADLRDCDLRGARLQGTDLTGAKIQGANLLGAEYDSHTQWSPGFDARKQGAQVVPFMAVQ